MIRLALILSIVIGAGCSAATPYREDSDTSLADGDADIDANADSDCTPGCHGNPCEPGEWATICAGTFTMGSPVDELGREDDETQHEVTLTRDFEILSTEVTQADFETLMGYNPSRRDSCGGGCPVESASWYEAAAYCNVLSDEAGLDQCYLCRFTSGRAAECKLSSVYSTPYDCPGYRLPTEAEWEYAARAGTTTATYNGDLDAIGCANVMVDPIGWYCGNSGDEPHEVGALAPNARGLYDTLGNVWEWTDDCYELDLGMEAVTDPVCSAAGSNRVERGGSWYSLARYTRGAFRSERTPGHRALSVGFRPARTLAP